jgi:hypothetical protein
MNINFNDIRVKTHNSMNIFFFFEANDKMLKLKEQTVVNPIASLSDINNGLYRFCKKN